MKRDDILMLEKQLDILEKESKILEEAYDQKDLKEFNSSKGRMMNSQKKIKNIIK